VTSRHRPAKPKVNFRKVIECEGIVSLSGQSPRSFRFGPFEADRETGELRKDGRKLRLQEKPFRVLVALLEERGNLVSRKALHERLWPGDTFVDFENGLNTAISKLREVLGDSAKDHRYIETLARRGYRFTSPVEELGAPVAAQRRELDIQRRLIEPDTVVVEIVGRIVAGPECQQIEWLISDLLSQDEKKIVLDISGVSRIDSTGVGIIVMCFGKMKKAGGDLRVAGARGVVEDVLKMTKVDSIISLYPTTAAAVAGVTGRDKT
jgi:anti-anti-sigma factor